MQLPTSPLLVASVTTTSSEKASIGGTWHLVGLPHSAACLLHAVHDLMLKNSDEQVQVRHRSPSSVVCTPAAPRRLNPDFTMRFDGLLVSPEDATRRIRGAMAAALNSSNSNGETSPQHTWPGLGLEDAQAIAVGVGNALKHAADSVYDQMEEEIMATAGRGDEPTNGWRGGEPT